MRVPPFHMVARWLQGIGLFVAGGIVGSAVFMIVAQHNFNELYDMYVPIKKERDSLLEDIESLKKYKDRQSVIKTVTVYLEGTGAADASKDKTVAGEITKRAEKDLSLFIGRTSGSVDPVFVRNLFARSFYSGIYEKDYVVRLTAMTVVGSELTVWIEAKEYLKR